MVAYSRTTVASRSTRKGFVVDGVDVVAGEFTRRADTIRPLSAAVVIDHIDKAAALMREKTTSQRVRGSITSDATVTLDGTTIYADAGPDRSVSNQAFIARFLEQGTPTTAPQPFVQPTADEIAGPFTDAIKGLT